MKNQHIYFVPGIGADHRVFENISLSDFTTHILVWEHPYKKEPIEEYVKRLLPQFKEDPFAIVGLSFGGIIAAELTKHFPQAKLILLSSIASRKETPPWARFGGWLKVNRVFSGNFLKKPNPVIRWFFSIPSGRDRELFNAILHDSDPDFLYWAFDELLNWKGNGNHRVHHIHGDRDRLLPIRFTTADICVKGGGHLMVLSHGKEISQMIVTCLGAPETATGPVSS